MRNKTNSKRANSLALLAFKHKKMNSHKLLTPCPSKKKPWQKHIAMMIAYKVLKMFVKANEDFN